MSHRIVGSNFDTMTSHPAASKALPIDFVPAQQSTHRQGRGSSSFACSDQSFFNRGQKRMTSQASMWKLGEVRSNAKGGKFLCLEPLFWQSEASLEIPRAFSEGQRRSVSFATDEHARLFWESGSGPRPIWSSSWRPHPSASSTQSSRPCASGCCPL